MFYRLYTQVESRKLSKVFGVWSELTPEADLPDLIDSWLQLDVRPEEIFIAAYHRAGQQESSSILPLLKSVWAPAR